MTDQDTPIAAAPEALPPMFFNAAKLPALLEAFALAQAEYAPVVRNKLVVQKLKNRETGQPTGAVIKFLYAELETMLDATRKPLSNHGLSFFQPLTTEADGITWVNSILAHKDGAMIISRMQVAGAKTQSDFGGNITYARRYAAGPALNVSAEDDSDNKGNEAEVVDDEGGSEQYPEQQSSTRARPVPARKSATAAPAKTAAAPAKVGTINAGQVKYLQTTLKALRLTDPQAQEFYERMGIDGFSDAITLAKFAELNTELNRLRDA